VHFFSLILDVDKLCRGCTISWNYEQRRL